MGALQGANQEVGAGTLEQTTQQAHDTQARQDYYQQQGYPFQVAQWLAAIDTGVGGSMGGTSTSTGNATTQGPTPNPWTQVAGTALTAASMFIKDGGRVTGKRAGFAAGGSPYGGLAPTWVPSADVHASAPNVHASLPSAPQAPAQQGLSKDQMKGFGVLANGIQNSSVGDHMQDYLQDMGSGDAAPLSDYMSLGQWRGGRIKRYAAGGFADGGDPTFDDRFDAAFPNMTAGVGASRPAFETVGPTYDDGGGKFRLSAPEDLNAWRGRVDRDNGTDIVKAANDSGLPPPSQVASAPDEVPSLPSEVSAGVSRPRMTASAAPPEAPDEGAEALGYSGPPILKPGVGAAPAPAPAAEDKSGGLLSSLGIKVTPELRQGLLQAGLSMMATTRGGPGSFLGAAGEAGMAGLGAYSKTVEAQQKHDLEQAKMAMEEEHFQQPYKQMTMAQKAAQQSADRPYREMTAAQKAADERAKDKAPFGWKENEDGTVTMVPNGPADPNYQRLVAEAKRGPGMDDDTLNDMVKAYRTGNTGVLTGIGRGAQGAENLQRFWKIMSDNLRAEGANPAELGAAKANFMSQTAALKSQAVREANVQSSVNEAAKTFPLLEKASLALPRTNYPLANKAIESYRSNTGSEEQRAYGAAIQAAITAYSQAMSRSGGNSVFAQQHAESLFNKADGHPAIMSTIHQLQQEMGAARDAPAETRQEILDQILSGGKAKEKPKPTPADIAYAKAHPEVKDKFKARFGVEP